LNCQGFLDSCPTWQFTFPENVQNVETDILFCRLEQLGHLHLRQPDGAVFQYDPMPRAPVLGLAEDYFRSRRWSVLTHKECCNRIAAVGQFESAGSLRLGTIFRPGIPWVRAKNWIMRGGLGAWPVKFLWLVRKFGFWNLEF
jgi:hypothetical protein